jgi:hypothetical protein
LVPAPSAPKLPAVNRPAKLVDASTRRLVSSTTRLGSLAPLGAIDGPSSLNWRLEPMPTLAVALSPSLSVIVAVSWIIPSEVRPAPSDVSGLLEVV